MTNAALDDSMAGRSSARGGDAVTPSGIAAHILKRCSLMRRIADRKRDRQGCGDLQGRLCAETTRQLRLEIRLQRKGIIA